MLTNVGLEHTRWLGPTVRDIAREKLAVVRPGSTLVLGADLHPDAFLEAHDAPAARVVVAPDSDPTLELGARGSVPAAQLRHGADRGAGVPRARSTPTRSAPRRRGDPRARAASRSSTSEPLTILDGAHNPGGMRALADSLTEVHHPLVVVVSVLDDKDATSMLRALLPHADALVCTSNANPRALPPATLASLTDAARRRVQRDGPDRRARPAPRAGPRPRPRRAGGSGARHRLDLPRRRPRAPRGATTPLSTL